MKDPFPLQPSPRIKIAIDHYLSRVAEPLDLSTLHYHSHEVALAFLFYNFIYNRLSPWISMKLCPRTYANLPRKTRLNWDIHVVSFVQSVLISAMALYVVAVDEERKVMGLAENWPERIWGYDGGLGLILAFACGYFAWDLAVSLLHADMFGFGILAHAVCALTVFTLGFRPYANYFGPTFILYELSTPFLNIHWFCDKLNLTGSRIQLINGIILLCTFFSCRLVWGTYSSMQAFSDIYRAWTADKDELALYLDRRTAALLPGSEDTMRYAGEMHMPAWLGATYLAANLTLNSLNFFWFNKMIQTIRKRFDPPFGTRRAEKGKGKAEEPADGGVLVASDVQVGRGVGAEGRKSVEVEATRRVRRRNSFDEIADEIAEAMEGMTGDDSELVGGL
ncbi:DUF887-domain-containing protein [Eremomyces bilateralis CBS 781.70]|uniref:DUF887-domain-containing protein n=1 Tax=Eremomyces bilateralis CBS 781.70 TaxID=1392243 RepID=A0A6G1G6R8_9PEZI|nr:DUF887-domain-containing protein [Eremomyces bilateralis CBS 781.70]KAF1813626.1 DUF887-domain-containing protein [Eremomyces bilateralis CBS 781.70]